MLTLDEILRAVILPAIVAAVLGLLARWRGWVWALPLIIGAAFVCGWVASHGTPSLPPRDGTDWLFWMIPYAVPLAMVLAAERRWKSWKPAAWLAVMAACTGLAAVGIASPLAASGAISAASLSVVALAFAAGAAVLAVVSRIAAGRVGAVALLCVMALAAGATGVVIFASNVRVVGISGLSAAAAIGGTAVALVGASGRVSMFAAAVTTLYAATLIAGLLSGGHYYAEGGVRWGTAAMLFGSPALVLIGALLPTRRKWVRAGVGVLAVGVAVAAIAAPIAIKAKREAEQDPYAAYK